MYGGMRGTWCGREGGSEQEYPPHTSAGVEDVGSWSITESFVRQLVAPELSLLCSLSSIGPTSASATSCASAVSTLACERPPGDWHARLANVPSWSADACLFAAASVAPPKFGSVITVGLSDALLEAQHLFSSGLKLWLDDGRSGLISFILCASCFTMLQEHG